MNYNYGNLRNYNGMNNMTSMNTWNEPTQQLGFVGVQNESEARAFPVALGNSVTFRDESQPNTFYTKTMGNSPLDRPIFEKYTLVKVESPSASPEATETPSKGKDIDLSVYALKTDLQPFEDVIAAIKKDIAVLKDRTKKKVVREENYDDE